MISAAGKISQANSPDRKIPLEYTRNIGIAAHIDAGKTTTTERILFYAGVVHKMGEVHEGTAVTDWMEQERERGITITSAAISCNWSTSEGPFADIQQQINIIDTPGHVDFTAEVERSLRVLDGAVGVFCAVAGVQPQSETVWRQMDKYSVPRICFINKMDRTGADFFSAVDDIRNKLGGNAHPIYIPIEETGKDEVEFKGLINLVSMRAHIYDESDVSGVKFDTTEIPDAFKETAEKYRNALIESLGNSDESFGDKLLQEMENKYEVTEADIKQAIRKATVALKFVAVMPGSSFKNKGVQMLLDAIVDYLPSPLDLPPMKGYVDEDKEVEIRADDRDKMAGLVFKLMTDSYAGKLVFFRVYSGVLKKGMAVLNPRTRRTEWIRRLLVMKANTREDIDVAYAGDICAIIGAKDLTTGDTLCDRDMNVLMEPPSFPDPVIAMSIEPNSKADQEKLSLGLSRLSEEDPTFVVSTNHETGQTIISGMGELHLDIIRDRLFREFKVGAEAGKPEIAFRETITQPADGEGKFIRQSGGRGQYGHAVLKIESNEKGKGIEVENEIVGGVIPKEYIKPTISGIEEAANNGTIAGYPVIDVKVRLVDGSFHEVDSSEMAFKMAGIFAFKDAMAKASPILLEPVMDVEVVTPEEYQGDIIGDLNRRRGRIQNMETKIKLTTIRAYVPLSTMFGYATDLRSLSKGRASYTMEPHQFEQIPANIAQSIIEASPHVGTARTI